MSFRRNEAICLFDTYNLLIPPKLRCHADGAPGSRVLVITDREESFIVSFEEGMQMMDMVSNHIGDEMTVSYQCCKDGKYIHQRRVDQKSGESMGSYAFFHIELEDDDGKTMYIPGQMTAKSGYSWRDGVEPILMSLMEGITVSKIKDGQKE